VQRTGRVFCNSGLIRKNWLFKGWWENTTTNNVHYLNSQLPLEILEFVLLILKFVIPCRWFQTPAVVKKPTTLLTKEKIYCNMMTALSFFIFV
jgi:hypothetical protein